MKAPPSWMETILRRSRRDLPRIRFMTASASFAACLLPIIEPAQNSVELLLENTRGKGLILGECGGTASVLKDFTDEERHISGVPVAGIQ